MSRKRRVSNFWDSVPKPKRRLGRDSALHGKRSRAGLLYSHAGQMSLDEIVGGAPYGASTIAGGKGERLPSGIELDGP